MILSIKVTLTQVYQLEFGPEWLSMIGVPSQKCPSLSVFKLNDSAPSAISKDESCGRQSTIIVSMFTGRNSCIFTIRKVG